MLGRMHSIQSFSTLDGPGIRFVLFLQGCPLRCACCHNPDTWDAAGGTEIDDAQAFARILRCRDYFGEEGGVTVSGGEPLLQSGFVRSLFARCREAGIHTALDTSGCILTDEALSVLDVTDLCLSLIHISTHSACEYPTPSITARTRWARVCIADRPKNTPRQSGSGCGQRSPMR